MMKWFCYQVSSPLLSFFIFIFNKNFLLKKKKKVGWNMNILVSVLGYTRSSGRAVVMRCCKRTPERILTSIHGSHHLGRFFSLFVEEDPLSLSLPLHRYSCSSSSFPNLSKFEALSHCLLSSTIFSFAVQATIGTVDRRDRRFSHLGLVSGSWMRVI